MNVVSVVRSTTRWVALQSALFRKFCGVDITFINHGPNHDFMAADFRQLNLPFQTIPVCKDDNPSISHSFALEWICEHYLRRTPEPLCILDMDIFPVRPIALPLLLDGFDVAGQVVMPDADHWHLWPGLLLIAADAPARDEIKMSACQVPNGSWLDSGGELLFWLREKSPRVNRLADRPMLPDDLPDSLRPDYDERHVFEMKASGAFFHIHGATNWFRCPAEIHNAREQLAERFLNGLVD